MGNLVKENAKLKKKLKEVRMENKDLRDEIAILRKSKAPTAMTAKKTVKKAPVKKVVKRVMKKAAKKSTKAVKRLAAEA